MDIRAWLTALGLQVYADRFEENELTVEDLGSLTSDDLKDELGVTKLIDRKKILAAIQAQGGPATTAQASGAPEPLDAARGALLYPQGLHPDQMPTFLAHPWRSLCVEDHPRLKLHWLTDTAELAVRWCVTVALAEVLAAHDSVLPKSLANRLRDNIQRPTLGRWLGILRDLTEGKPSSPRLSPKIFELYAASFEPRFMTAHQGGTMEGSLLVMRNQIAHGGGMSRQHAQELLTHHAPLIEGLLREVLAATQGADALAVDTDRVRRLVGLSPPIIERPESLSGAQPGTWLVKPGDAIPMLPLVMYGPVKVLTTQGELQVKPNSDTAQVFTRAEADRLSYTPLGRDEAHSEILEVELFRAIFRMDEAQQERREGAGDVKLPWDEAITQARQMSADLIGREAELKQIKAWLKARDAHADERPRLGWLSGGPGFGKSLLMARLAADYASSNNRGLFFHRFTGGAQRHQQRHFLRFLLAALSAWEPLQAALRERPLDVLAEGDALIEELERALGALQGLTSPNPRSPKPSFWIMIDGLDEIVAQEPRFMELLGRLASNLGTVWLLCGRAEHGLDELLRGKLRGSEAIFEQGLPQMSAQDLRAMLLEGLGNARYTLLKRDSDTEDGQQVQNEFIERVVRHARGLPLYVHLLLEDLRTGALTVHDEGRLPDGLTAYYDALMDRVGLSSVKRDLPLIVCALALAEEPLEAPSLAGLLAPELDDVEEYLPRVQAALRVGQALLRRTGTPEGGEGYTLYHQSFEEYIRGKPARADQPEVSPAPALAQTLVEAQRKLYRMASRWQELRHEELRNLRNHLFRWGTEYALRWQGKDGLEQVRRRLESFEYILARTESLPATAALDLVSELEQVLALTPTAQRAAIKRWESFLRERAHILARGDRAWPASRILVQLAAEHAQDSPITQDVCRWLESGQCDWVWMRKARIPAHIKADLCLRVFEGHRDRVQGVERLPSGALLSWSKDKTLRLWSAAGQELGRLEGHEDSVDGALLWQGGARAVSWSRDGSLRLWDLERMEPLGALLGHTKEVLGAALLPSGELLSWSKDKTLRLWSLDPCSPLETLTGHTRALRGVSLEGEDLALSWSEDRSVRLWSLSSHDALTTLKGDKDTAHEREVTGALMASAQRVLSWGMDGHLVWWDVAAQAPLCRLEGHEGFVTGALMVDEARALSWSKDGTLRLWSLHEGRTLATMRGHTRGVQGAILTPDGRRVVSWSEDADLRVWELQTGQAVHVLSGHASLVYGVRWLDEQAQTLLSWAGCGTLRVWDLVQGQPLALLEGHTGGVWGASVLEPEQQVLSWSWDGTIRRWAWRADAQLEEVVGHRGWIQGVERLGDGRALSYSADGEMFLWDKETSKPLASFQGHDKSVGGVQLLEPDDQLLSWAGDQTARLWRLSTGEPLAVYAGHEKTMQGAMALDAEHVLTWSSDATVRLWRRATGQLLHPFAHHKKLVAGAMRWDDARVVTWGSDGLIGVLDWRARQVTCALDAHEGKTIKGARRVLGDRLLSWGSDAKLRLTDVEAGQLEASLEGHAKIVERVKMLDATRAASMDKDSAVLIWDLSARALLRALEGDEEPSDGAVLMSPDVVATWSRKAKRFIEWRLSDGAKLAVTGYDEALRLRPDLWRERYASSRSPNQLGALRLHSTEGGVELYLDDDATLPRQPLVCWRETGFWMADLLDAEAPTIHAGPYVHHLHLYHGAQRIRLDAP